MYYVTYAKVMDDKEDGVYVAGVHFGGLAADKSDAEKVAKECVNQVKGGTIIPKIIQTEGTSTLPAIMDRAIRHFEVLEEQMVESEEINNRNGRKR